MKLTQQRRFFQTNGQCKRAFVAGVSKLKLHRLTAIFAALLFFGCASLTQDRVSLLVQIASQAAQIGAQQWLVKHPDQRQLFNDVIAAIAVLVQAGNTNQLAYVEQLKRLPTTTLAGPDGAVVIASEHLIIKDAVANKATIVTEPATMPVVKATLAGLRKGCTPLPPVPVIVVPIVLRYPPHGTPAPTFKAGVPMTDAQLDRQFEDALRRKGR